MHAPRECIRHVDYRYNNIYPREIEPFTEGGREGGRSDEEKDGQTPRNPQPFFEQVCRSIPTCMRREGKGEREREDDSRSVEGSDSNEKNAT
jgi:hypothetical protein